MMHFTKTEALKALHELRVAVCEALDRGVSEERETELFLALEDLYDGMTAVNTRSAEVLTREERLMTHEIVRRTESVLTIALCHLNGNDNE